MSKMVMSNVDLEFIGWDQSALELVAERLLTLAAAQPDDFRRASVVVPTAESGRRLKEWMADRAQKPLLMPRMMLTGQLIQMQGENVASEVETLAAWVEVLTEGTGQEPWNEFFPRPVQENQVQDWALRTADRLAQLHTQMEQFEVTIEGLLSRLAGREGVAEDLVARWEALQGDEERRWEALRALFAAVDERLMAWGKEAAWKARQRWLAGVHTAAAPLLILACLPELSPQLRSFLRAYPGRVLIWVNAPEELREGFDAYGCVKPEFWAERCLPPRLEAEDILVESSAQGMARAALVAVSEDASQEATLASCDAEFTPSLVTAFAQNGWRVHVPEGRSFRVSDLAALPDVLVEAVCAEKLTWSIIEPLLRNVAVQRLAGGKRFDSYAFGRLLDQIRERLIPDSMPALLRYLNPELELPGRRWEVADIAALRSEAIFEAVQWLDAFIQRCRRDVGDALRTLEARLMRLYRGEMLDHAARQMAARARALAGFLCEHPRRPEAAWALVRHALSQYKEMLQDSPREQAHLEALGWRELAYSKGKLMVLTGLHEGCVPEPLPADPFLPDALRQALGMPCMRSREARDCYLLSALMSRKEVVLKVILSRSSADGTGSPVEPSPLLYHCDMETLVKRVQHLYKELRVEDEYTPYALLSLAPRGLPPAAGEMESVQEQLIPQWENPFAAEAYRFSPSKINKFLACPLRFWMKYALGIDPWETYNEDKADLEAAEYGTLIHAVLEDVGMTYRCKDSLLPIEEMYAFAVARLHAHAEAHYGRPQPPVLVKHQMLSFCNKCLRPFLKWHSDQLLDGWECYACEHKVEDWELPLPNGQVAHIAMRADRIDYHPASGRWRIIDYKTHERAPKSDHLEMVQQVELWNEKMGAERFPLFDAKYGRQKALRPHRWKDVQLPMYAAWLMQEKKCSLPEVAYYNLPRNRKGEPKYTPMAELSEEALESALTWAKSAILLMREGQCLYSAESLGCKAYGSYSENEDLADPRQLFYNNLKSVTLSQHEPCHE